MPHYPDTEKLTKLNLAKRQLSLAIKFFLEDQDPVTYYSLAYSSHEIIRNIVKVSGVNSMIKDDSLGMIDENMFDQVMAKRYGEKYKRVKKKDFGKKMNFFIDFDYNETKHGGSKLDEEVTIHWGTAQIMMVDSIEMLKRIGENLSFEHLAFILWTEKMNPGIYGFKTRIALGCFEKNFGEIESKKDALQILKETKKSNFLKATCI